MRRGRYTLPVLAVVFVLLLIVALWQGGILSQLQQDAAATSTPLSPSDLSAVFNTFAVLDIEALRLEDPSTGQNFTMLRDQNGNWAAPDVAGVLSADYATGIARTVVLLPYYGRVTPEAGVDYGFGDNNPYRLTISVVLADGTRHVVLFGARTPAQDGYYALADDQPELYVVEPRAVEFLRAQLTAPPVNITPQATATPPI